MLENFKESFNMDKRMVLVNSHGLMNRILKGSIEMIRNKDKENFTIKREI